MNVNMFLAVTDFIFHVIGAYDHQAVVSVLIQQLIKPCPAGSIEVHAGLIQKHNICIAQNGQSLPDSLLHAGAEVA